jgi:predicted protein tyrosine phosphatase
MRENPESSSFKITICGIDELHEHSGAAVTHVLSILDPEMPQPRVFCEFPVHDRLELRFHDVIEENAYGYTAPQRSHVEDLLAFGRTALSSRPAQVHVLVHCHMGISRSTAAATLLLAEAYPLRAATDIVSEVARIRTKAWPNLRMIEFGDALLGRSGALIRAVRARHREVAAGSPQVVEFMRNSGRGRELE